MRKGTPRVNQGQTVEMSYGWHDGCYYRCTLDRSDGSQTWHIADDESAELLAEIGYDAGGDCEEPTIAEWAACKEPDTKD